LDAQKKSWRYQERDEVARAAFVTALEQVPERDRVYADESGCDDRLGREHGWSPCGEICVGTRVGHATERLSVVAAWQAVSGELVSGELVSGELVSGELVSGEPVSGKTALIAPLSFDGTCHSRLFELWLRVMLCPLLRAGQVLILDNARFHRKKAVQRILQKVGCRALFLPAYSPDLNPIEHQWHRLKTSVRTNRLQGMGFKQAVEAALV
jgi:hypothetical protein